MLELFFDRKLPAQEKANSYIILYSACQDGFTPAAGLVLGQLKTKMFAYLYSPWWRTELAYSKYGWPVWVTGLDFKGCAPVLS